MAKHAAREASQWRLFVMALQDLPLEDIVHRTMKRLSLRRWSGNSWLLIAASGAVALLYWHGRLFFATGSGIGVMVLVYLMHDWNPNPNWFELQKFLNGWNQPFVLSIAAGAIATLMTYMAAAVWADSESAWIASGAILQGMGTLAVLLLLAWQMLHRQANKDHIHYHQLVSNLTHDEPLKRLIAVRQLTDIVSVLDDGDRTLRRVAAKKPSRREVADYFRLMLLQEPESIVREAVFDGLQTLEIVHQLRQATAPPLQLPLRTPAVSRSRRTPVAIDDHYGHNV